MAADTEAGITESLYLKLKTGSFERTHEKLHMAFEFSQVFPAAYSLLLILQPPTKDQVFRCPRIMEDITTTLI